MSKFREPATYRDQTELTCIDAMVDDHHVVRSFERILRGEAFASVFADLRARYNRREGRPAFDPFYLVALYVYGRYLGVCSSRRLEAACRNRLDVMWLMRCQVPDYSTISRFLTKHRDVLNQVLQATRSVAIDTDVISAKQIAVDGTRIAASGSKWSLKTKDEILRLKALIAAKSEEIRREFEANDTEESDVGAPPSDVARDRNEFDRQQKALDAALEALKRREEEAIAKAKAAMNTRAGATGNADADAEGKTAGDGAMDGK